MSSWPNLLPVQCASLCSVPGPYQGLPRKVSPSTPGLPWALRTLCSLVSVSSAGSHFFCIPCPCSFQNVPVSFLVSLKSSWNPPGRLMLFLVTSPKSGSACFLLLAPPTTLCSSAAFLRGPRVVCPYLLLWAEWELLEGRALVLVLVELMCAA